MASTAAAASSPSLSLLNPSPASSSSSRSGLSLSLASKPRLPVAFPPLYLLSHTTSGSDRRVCFRRSKKSSRPSVVVAAKIVPSEKKEKVLSTDGSFMQEEKAAAEEEEDELLDYEKSLPENVPDFWEGPQFNTLGFVVQYLWAIGVVVALIACGIAVRTYNEGATDFRETAVYKESLRTQEKLQAAPETDSDDSADPLLLDAPPLQEN